MRNFTLRMGNKRGSTCLRALYALMLVFTFSTQEMKGQSKHTVTFSGNPNDFNSEERIAAAANNTDYYITFDDTHLYIGAFRTGGSTFGGSDNFAIYIDTDPNATPTAGTGTTSGQSYNSVTGTLPFSANYNVHVEQSYQEARSFGSSWGSTISGLSYWTSSTAREVKIPFSSIGSPHALYLTMWMGYSGGFYSNAPGSNLAPSGNPTITGYFGGIGVSSSDCNPVNITNTPITDIISNSVPVAGALYGKVLINSGTVTATNNFNVAPGGSIIVSGGTFDISGRTIELGGTTIGIGRGTTINTSGSGILTTSSTSNLIFNGEGNITGNNLTLNSITRINRKFTPLASGGLTIGNNGALDIRLGGFVSTNAPTYATGSELRYNSGAAYTASTEWTTAASGIGVPSNVVIGNAVSNSEANFGTSNQARYITNNLTISNATTGSALVLSSASGGNLFVGGNFTNNGTFNPNGRAVTFTGTATTQTLSGTLNGTTTNSFNRLTIDKISGGVVLANPVNVTNILTLTSGNITTTSTNILNITNNAVGAIVSGGTNSYINGPLRRALPNSGSGSWIFPLGVGTTYLPFSITNPASGSTAVITAEAKLGDTGGTVNASIDTKSTTEYWEVTNSGSLTGNVSIAKTDISPNDIIGRAPTLTGVYASLGGSTTSSLIATNTVLAATASGSSSDFYVLAKRPATPTITSVTNTPAVAGQPSGSGYTGQTITINGTNFASSGVSVTINGVSATTTFVNDTQLTAVVANTGVAASGLNLIVTNTLSGITATFSTFNYLGHTTTATGSYTTAATWLGTAVPPAGATLTVNHNPVSLSTTANTAGTVTITSAGNLTLDNASASLTTTTLTNNGTLAFTAAGTLNIATGGTLTNNSTFTAGTGLVNFNGAGTLNGLSAVSFNNLSITTGTVTIPTTLTIPTINGTFTINGGSVNNPPIYGSASTLTYNIAYNRFTEWNATGIGAIGTTPGYPNNVIINNGTFDLANGSTTERALAGNLTINTAGTFNLNAINAVVTVGGNVTTNGSGALNMGTTNQPLTILGSLTNNGSLTLSGTAVGDLNIAGNFTNNGTFNPNGRAVTFTGTAATQTLSGTLNGTSTNCFNFLIVNKSSGGVTLATPVNVTNILTLTSGNITTTSTNILNITNNAVGAIASGGANSYINGPLRRALPNSGSGNWIFPLGVGTTYLPFSITNPASGSTPVITAEAKLGDTGGTVNASIDTKSTTEYWEVTNSGSLTGTVSLAKTAISPNDIIGRAPTLTGVYASLGGSTTSSLIATNTVLAATASGSSSDFYVLAKRPATPTITSVTNTPAVAGQPAGSGYTGQTITINGTNFASSGVSVTINGVSATTTFVNDTQLTAVVANTGVAASGLNLVVTNTLSGITATFSTFNYLGHTTTATGSYTTAATWLGTAVPPAGATLTVNHNPVSLSTTANTAGTVTITSAGNLTLDNASASLTTTTLTNNGTLAFTAAGTLNIATGGTLTNNNTFTAGTGSVIFNGAGTLNGSSAVSFNNLSITTGTVTIPTTLTIPTINGTFTINGGSVNNPPIYGSASTLMYNTGSGYTVFNEWTGNATTAGTGIPQNVTINNNTNLTILATRGIAGNLNIISGSLTLGGVGNDLYIAGNWTRASTATFSPSGSAVFFNGSTTQVVTVTGGGTETFNFLYIGGSGTLQLASTTDIAVTSTNGLTLDSSNTTSTLDLNGRTCTISGGGNLSLASGNRKITSSISGGVFRVTTSALAISNTGTLESDTSTTIVLETGCNFGAGNASTINGTLQLNTNSFVNVHAPKYGATSTLIYNSGGTYDKRLEWTSAIGVSFGVPHHVILRNNTLLIYGFTTGARGMTGNLTIEGGSHLNMGNCGGPLTVTGNINQTGTMTLGNAIGDDIKTGGDITFNSGYAFNPNNRAVYFIKNVASGIQTITAPVGFAPTFHYAVFEVPLSGSATVVLNTDLSITAPAGVNVISFGNANDILDLNGRTLTLGTASVNNIVFGAGTFKGSNTSNMTLLGNGSIGTLSFTSGSQTLGNLTVNRQDNTIAMTLGTPLTINTSLTLTKGLVDLGSNLMTLANAATATGGATSYVIADESGSTGRLRKNINNANRSFTFPIGDKDDASANGSQYTPATVNYSTGTLSSSASMTVSVNDIKHPQMQAPTDFLTRYWKLETTGITGSAVYEFTGTYYPSDVEGTESNSISGRWNGNLWTEGTTIGTPANTLSITVNTDATSVFTNEMSAGYPLGAPEINVVGNNNTIVSGDTTPSLTDFTDFGDSPATRSRTFLIQNLPTAKRMLTISGVTITGTHSSDFTVTTAPASSVIVGGTTYLVIKFAPSGPGIRTATVTINNNDQDESSYTFAIQGQGIDYTECSFGTEETIAIQDFEDSPATPTWGYTATLSSAVTIQGGTAYGKTDDNGTTVTSDAFIGAKSFQVNNTSTEIVFDALNTSTLSDVSIALRVGAFSNAGSSSGLDTPDYIKVFISTDNGSTWIEELNLYGNSNARWSFISGTGIGTTVYDGNNTVETTLQPMGGGYRTDDGYSTLAITNLPLVETLQMKIILLNNDSNEVWAIDNVELKGKRKASKTWNGTAWSGDGTPPTASQIAIIDDNLTLPYTLASVTYNNLEACECLVNTGSVLTIGDEEGLTPASLDIQGVLNNEGDVIIYTNSSLVQHDDAAENIGTITIERTTPDLYRYDYTYWSSPLTLASGFKLGTDPISLSPETLFDKFYKWNHTADPQGWQLILSGNEVMNPGTGYIVRAPQNYDIEGASGATAETYTASFVGIPNNGIVEHPYTGDDTEDKYNLLGNPYPSALNIESFLSYNDDYLDGTIYLWTHNTAIEDTSGTGFYTYNDDDYATYNFSGSTATAEAAYLGGAVPTGFVASGQSFFVKGITASTDPIVFNNSMRVPLNNDQFFRPSNSEPVNNWQTTGKHRIWLNLTGQNAFNQAMVGYIQNATNGLDWGYDGDHFGGNKVSLYSVLEDKKLVIQGRALPFDEQDQVPLGYKTTLTGNLKISIDHFDGLFEGQDIYLEDLDLNIVHDLKASDYTFTTVPGTFNDRFVLRYVPQETLSTPEIDKIAASVLIWKDKTDLKVLSPFENIQSVTVYDLLGRKLFDEAAINSTQFSTSNVVHAQQTLIVKVELNNHTIVTKKVIF